MTADVMVVGRQAGVLREAADLAENGRHDINNAQSEALNAITEAEEDGFSVAEDLSVTDARRYDINTIVARNKAATEHAEDIRWYAERLLQTDSFVGERLLPKAAELDGIRFEGEREDRDGSSGHVRLVDNKVQHDAEGKDQSGDEKSAVPGQAPGRIGPFAVPKSVEDAAKKPNGMPEDKPAGADPELRTPHSLEEMLLPEGRAEPDPSAPPPFTAAQIAEFKSQARKLLQQQGVAPDQIESRVDVMLAETQRIKTELDSLPPYTPPAGSPPARPSYSDGFGDAWRRMEDSVHSLTGQNGFESFKDAWKGMGSGVVETVKDPYGTAFRAIESEIEAFRNNPEYWHGQKGFDAAFTGATLPFGGELIAARGALNDVVSPGVPHDVVHGADGINSHPPISVDHSVGDHSGLGLGDAPLQADVVPDFVPLPDTGPYHLPDPVHLTTPPDGATFWSGRNGDGIIGIGPISAGGNGAAELIAGGNSATTLEGLLDANGIQPPKWSPTDVYADNWWSAVSQIYAENASGEVHAVVGSNLRPGNVWENVELPRLMENPNVTKVIVIDPDTGIHTTIFER
ncbi:hypothetical protein [Mycolicibacterium sp. HK-90]|uniref:hypothetical protein n=1 Tax=Mycolicibacterium sp. HK-90 TaxID=3056937 RepID=UPI00265963F9|nr:hypothetical protein [Mycolicibacterium sp. HK-90]WKG05766.1 hypothetical protein QU592_12080 [Mycolicibacterium sp. HK-90]